MRQIFAIGGNFMAEPWEEPLIQRHLLGLSNSAEPSICFLGTASGDKATNIEQFYRQMSAHSCRLTHLNMFAPSTMDFSSYFKTFDIIYVGGGATRNLMTIWRDWGVDVALAAAYDNGTILSGTSAGAICWFEGCITDSFPKVLLPLDCMGLLKGSACTHYSSRPDRRRVFQAEIANGAIPSPGLALDDHVAAHFVDGGLQDLVTARAGKYAYRIERTEADIREQKLEPRLIASDASA